MPLPVQAFSWHKVPKQLISVAVYLVFDDNTLCQGIWDLSKDVSKLLERVSAEEVVKADSNLSICINFTVFSFVMAYNNKKVCAIFRWYNTSVSKASTFDSQNSIYLKILGFIRYDFKCFGDKDSFSIP